MRSGNKKKKKRRETILPHSTYVPFSINTKYIHFTRESIHINLVLRGETPTVIDALSAKEVKHQDLQFSSNRNTLGN